MFSVYVFLRCSVQSRRFPLTGGPWWDRGESSRRGSWGIFSTSRPSPLQCTGYVVLDEHVGPAHQLLHYGFAVGVPEVHAHAPLVPVQRREVQAQAVGGAVGTAKVRERRPVAAAVVAGDRPLDLDHVRAHVGQDHRAVRARGHPGHVDHAYAVQRSRTTATRAAQVPVESYRRCGRRSEEEEERAADEHDDGVGTIRRLPVPLQLRCARLVDLVTCNGRAICANRSLYRPTSIHVDRRPNLRNLVGSRRATC